MTVHHHESPIAEMPLKYRHHVGAVQVAITAAGETERYGTDIHSRELLRAAFNQIEGSVLVPAHIGIISPERLDREEHQLSASILDHGSVGTELAAPAAPPARELPVPERSLRGDAGAHVVPAVRIESDVRGHHDRESNTVVRPEVTSVHPQHDFILAETSDSATPIDGYLRAYLPLIKRGSRG